MAKKKKSEEGQSALDVIEEATHVLRQGGLGLMTWHLLGAIPFSLGLLFFVSDMARSSQAEHHLPQAATGMVFLFIWMKFCQVTFCDRLNSAIIGKQTPKRGFFKNLNSILVQTSIQALAIVVLPIFFIVTIPFPHAFALFQNALALDDGSKGIRALLKESNQQVKHARMQNFNIQLILGAFICIVFLATMVGLGTIPHMAKILTGIENQFTQSYFAILNTTTLMIGACLTWMICDPLIKAIYTLRCFYGAARGNGIDLKLTFRDARQGSAFAAIIVSSLLFLTPQLKADEASQNSPIETQQLDQKIDKTLQKRIYQWRMPKGPLDPLSEVDLSKMNFIERFYHGLGKKLDAIGDFIGDGLKKFGRTIDDIVDYIRKAFGGKKMPKTPDVNPEGVEGVFKGLFYLILIAALIGVTIIVIKIIRKKQQLEPAVVETEETSTIPDLEDENIAADQLPEDEWMALAAKMMDEGNLRLALRAMYLSGLAHLAERQFVTIAKFKSNLDYQREIQRRARAFPETQNAFSDNVRLFDLVWYGMREVNTDQLNHFRSNLSQIKQC